MRGAAVFAGCGPAIAAPPVKTSGSVAPAIAQLQSCDARCVQTLHYCNTTFCRAKRFTRWRSSDFPLGGRDCLGAGVGEAVTACRRAHLPLVTESVNLTTF